MWTRTTRSRPTKKVVLAAQGGVALKIRGNFKTSNILDDKSVINGYIRWLQENFDKSLEEATDMAMPLTPATWPGRDTGGLVLKPGPGGRSDVETVSASPSSRPPSQTEVMSDPEEEPDHKPESQYPRARTSCQCWADQGGGRCIGSESASGSRVCTTTTWWWWAKNGRRSSPRRGRNFVGFASARRRRWQRSSWGMMTRTMTPARSPPRP